MINSNLLKLACNRGFAIDLSAHSKTGERIDVSVSNEGEDGQLPLYFDNQATTPLDPRVLDTMMPYLSNNFGNPHSKSHKYGWDTE